jgi:hypothetical protein
VDAENYPNGTAAYALYITGKERDEYDARKGAAIGRLQRYGKTGGYEYFERPAEPAVREKIRQPYFFVIKNKAELK